MGLEASEKAREEWLQELVGVSIQVSLDCCSLPPPAAEGYDAEQE